MKSWKFLRNAYLSLSGGDKRNLVFVIASYFLVLFGYSLIRAVTTGLYLQTYGAKATPVVSFYAVFVLFGVMWVLDRLQKRCSVQSLFSSLSVLSALVFWLSYEGLQRGMSSCASVLFIWREVYIVFLIHMTWGYVNNVLRESVAKYLFGFIAASGAIGGVIGGVVPSLVTHSFGPRGVILVGVLQLLASAILFFKTKHLHEEEVSIVEKPTPIASLKGVGGYVTFILVLVVLSQFCLGIVEFLFNVNFQNAVPDVAQKVDKLGLVYAGTNAVAFIIKLLVLPVLFSITTNARIQVLVPVFYLGLSVLGLGVGSEILLMTAISFVVIKGMDYSAFSVSKELLYYPLKPAQKFGAKYIIDMFAYRLSKAVISFALIFIQGPLILNGLLIFFLGVWIALVVWPTFPLARASQSVVEE